ncbi:endoglucanase A-like [Schistocerca gregaria]|uniref:endoglucanase A-like n=1 Tax=Schistocerca gregaria TaxID=7010 RepID=UPI00211E3F82|nr:endoglucanase A-like [Schistocerca gregaria]
MASLRSILLLLLSAAVACHGGTYDYSEVIQKSLLFYQAERTGKLSGMDPSLYWRKDSCLDDKGQNGEDLTGGYFDAGDYMKFGFTLAYTLTLLSWGAISYEQGYASAGALDGVRDAIKWGTDYLLKAHVSANELYVQVGNTTADHNYWGRPEDMTLERPAYKVDTEHPGSDVAAETAAALAAASGVFRSVDATYADTLLQHAKELIAFADNYRAIYTESGAIPDSDGTAYLSKGYGDELAWGYAWLAKITNDQTYLQRAEEVYEEFGLINIGGGLNWEQKASGVDAVLANISSNGQYLEHLRGTCNYLLTNEKRTPKGLLFLSEWGSLQVAATVALMCLEVSNLGLDQETLQAFAKQQIDYALGDAGRSYVVGFGENPPLRAHHRAASCPDLPATCDWTQYSTTDPNPHEVTGALVGGPGENDDYSDDRTDYVHNEVCIVYNAPFTGVLAALKQLGY